MGDFPAVVLAEVAAEVRSQLGAYIILRESARVAGSGEGSGRSNAAHVLEPPASRLKSLR